LGGVRREGERPPAAEVEDHVWRVWEPPWAGGSRPWLAVRAADAAPPAQGAARAKLLAGAKLLRYRRFRQSPPPPPTPNPLAAGGAARSPRSQSAARACARTPRGWRRAGTSAWGAAWRAPSSAQGRPRTRSGSTLSPEAAPGRICNTCSNVRTCVLHTGAGCNKRAWLLARGGLPALGAAAAHRLQTH
jgi:hypothetical protein